MRIALVNCLNLPEHDPDEVPLLNALRDRGHEAGVLSWDDPGADPGAYDACVLRATWNYYRHLDAFAAWLEHADRATTLLNPLETVRWNLHKGYLLELERAGVAVVPTALFDRGAMVDLGSVLRDRGWRDVVVKPAISAGSHGTKRFGAGEIEAVQAWLDRLLAQGDAMVQRFEPSVLREGEVSIVCIGGEVSHAIEKRPRFDGDEESVVGRSSASDAERAFAERVLGVVSHEHVYARVDVFPSDNGGLLLSELELIEPSLFFDHGPGSADRFAAALESALV